MRLQVSISDIQIGKRFRQEIGDLKPLEKSIAELNCLLHPIVVEECNNGKWKLIAGRRRILACKNLGWSRIPINPVKITQPQTGELHENGARKNFTGSEIVAISEYISKHRIGHRPKKGEESAPFRKGKTRDLVQEITGTSHNTVTKLKEIVKAAKDDPKEFAKILADVDSGKKSVNTAHNQIKIYNRNKNIAKVVLPTGQWNVLEIDFPWGYRNENVGATGGGSANQQYPTIHPEEILEKEVPKFKKIIAKDAVIFMWVTTPLLSQIIQLRILENLGFSYKTMITWHKKIPKWFFGGKALGFWFSIETEHCLVGVKGKIKPFRSNLPNFIETEMLPHSEKPKEFKELFEYSTKYIPGRKMFEGYQRTPRKGWTGFGNQIKEKCAIV